MDDRKNQNVASAKSKAKIKVPAPSANAMKGDLVFLKNDGNKITPRELYVVTDILPDKYVSIQKLLHALENKPAKLQTYCYKVKQTDIFLAPNQPIIVPPCPVDPEVIPVNQPSVCIL